MCAMWQVELCQGCKYLIDNPYKKIYPEHEMYCTNLHLPTNTNSQSCGSKETL